MAVLPAVAHVEGPAGDLEHPPGHIASVCAEPHHQRGGVGRVFVVPAVGGLLGVHDPGGHAGASVGGDGVHQHPVAAPLGGLLDGERGHTGFGRGVVALADRAQQPGPGAGVDEPPLHVLTGFRPIPPVGRGVAGRGEVALEVDPHDGVPLRLAHVGQHPVAQESGVAHQRVEAAPRGDGLGDHGLGLVPVGHIGGVGFGLAPHGPDLGHHFLGGLRRAPRAVALHPQVVDQHPGPLGGELQGVGSAQPPGRSGDDHHPAVGHSPHQAGPYSSGFSSDDTIHMA